MAKRVFLSWTKSNAKRTHKADVRDTEGSRKGILLLKNYDRYLIQICVTLWS